MEDELHPALLPAGLRDLLPPDAAVEARLVETLMASLAAHGYERVKPPLVEFESSLLGGPGAAMAQDTFRLMDPISHRMVGVRADMTLQIARIATVRLVKSPRPLRLAYAGQVLRVTGTQLRPERQFGQIGAELIGSERPEADAEIVVLAAEALSEVGIAGLSVDLNLPTLVPIVLEALGVAEDETRRLRAAVDHKDAAALAAVGGEAASLLRGLMDCAGPAKRALERLAEIALPPAAAEEVRLLASIVDLIRAAMPGLALTVDPVENRGFEYHTGMSFTLFARDIRGELGRGGRYQAGRGQPVEPSTGFTLYTDTVRRGVPDTITERRVYLPLGTNADDARALRRDGWITVSALSAGDVADEAQRLRCGHVYLDGACRPVVPDR
jgi:ATP phosphoribosyltransferase regulatory subunit